MIGGHKSNGFCDPKAPSDEGAGTDGDEITEVTEGEIVLQKLCSDCSLPLVSANLGLALPLGELSAELAERAK